MNRYSDSFILCTLLEITKTSLVLPLKYYQYCRSYAETRLISLLRESVKKLTRDRNVISVELDTPIGNNVTSQRLCMYLSYKIP
jgi:hypothetical protein